MLEGLFDISLGKATSQLTMFLGLLAQLLSFSGVVGCCQICSRLLGEYVLNREYFVEQLELLLCGLAVRLRHPHPVVL